MLHDMLHGKPRAPAPESILTTLADPMNVPKTILLVDGDVKVRSICRRVLHESGFGVLEAASGAEAVFLAEQFFYPIQLLVCDFVMPKMTGVELADRLGMSHPETAVLLMFSPQDGAVLVKARTDKPSAFLQKPFSPDALLRKVREVIRDDADDDTVYS